MVQKFNGFNGSAECRRLRDALDTYLKNFSDAYGVKITIGKMKYSGSNVIASVEVAVVNPETGVAQSKERTDFLNMAWQYGLKSSDLDRVVQTSYGPLKIVGLQPRRHKYPILAHPPHNPTARKLYTERMMTQAIQLEDFRKQQGGT